jgi:hypothetical protein
MELANFTRVPIPVILGRGTHKELDTFIRIEPLARRRSWFLYQDIHVLLQYRYALRPVLDASNKILIGLTHKQMIELQLHGFEITHPTPQQHYSWALDEWSPELDAWPMGRDG